MKKGQKSGNDDDKAVWEYVTRSVRPIGRPYAKKAAATAKTAPKTAAKPAAPREKPPVKPVQPPRITVPAPAAKPFDRGEEEALRKGKRDIEATLDLHGMNQGEAYDALHRAVRAAQRDGRRTLLVITGKGKVGGGVLRRLLPLWLEDGELRSSVLAFSVARPEDGGTGAFYLRLRKKK